MNVGFRVQGLKPDQAMPRFIAREELSDDGDAEEDEMEPEEAEFYDEPDVFSVEDEDQIDTEENNAAMAAATGVLDEDMQSLLMGLSSKDDSMLMDAISRMRSMLASEQGAKLLQEYVLASPKCVELLAVWEKGTKSITTIPLMLLLWTMFRHPAGLRNSQIQEAAEEWKRKLAIQLRIDKFALHILHHKLPDIYSLLSSNHRSRENAALKIMSAIVLRGRLLGKEVASKFDFGLDALRRLARHHNKMNAMPSTDILRLPSRVAFIEFAVSFLEVGDLGLLRWVLQKRSLYAGLLHGISKDDEETCVKVLTMIQKKILCPTMHIPVGVKVGMFGDIALDQLSRITVDSMRLESGDLAHNILLSLCTDPSHGICPEIAQWDLSLKSKGLYGGGQGRLLRLMARLKPTGIARHRELLLAIAKTRPVLAAAYIDSSPFSMEPRDTPSWYSSMSLISSLISFANVTPPFVSMAQDGVPPPEFESSIIQCNLRRIWPRNLSRVALNRGLLHQNLLIKHASLRLLLEILKSLRDLLTSITAAADASQGFIKHGINGKDSGHKVKFTDGWENFFAKQNNKPAGVDENGKQMWLGLHTYFQDNMRMLLPDCHSLSSIYSTLKRVTKGDSLISNKAAGKKRKRDGDDVEDNEDTSGLAELEEIWGLDLKSIIRQEANVCTNLLLTKILEVFTLYQEAIPLALTDANFDAFKFVPDDPKTLTCLQRKALLGLLLAVSGYSTLRGDNPVGTSNSLPLFRHMKLLLKLLSGPIERDVKEQIQQLSCLAMSTTGAFDNNAMEVVVWLRFLPCWNTWTFKDEMNTTTTICMVHAFEEDIVDFLCDAVYNVGKNMYKYLEELHSIFSNYALENATAESQANGYGPLVISVLKKCVAVTRSKLDAPKRAAICIYVSSVLKLLLCIQVHPRSLAIAITSTLTSASHDVIHSSEWGPLKSLLLHCQSVLGENAHFTLDHTICSASSDCSAKLRIILAFCRQDDTVPRSSKAIAFAKSLSCLSPEVLIASFCQLVYVCKETFMGDFTILVMLLAVYSEALLDLTNCTYLLETSNEALLSQLRTQDSCEIGKRETESSISSVLYFYTFCPFDVLFTGIAGMKEARLLADPYLKEFLMLSLRKVPKNETRVVMLSILSCIYSLATSSREYIDVCKQLDVCFEFVRYLLLSIKDPNVDEAEKSLLVKDVLTHPMVSLFLNLHGPIKMETWSSWPFQYNEEEKFVLKDVKKKAAAVGDAVHCIDRHLVAIVAMFLQSYGFRKPENLNKGVVDMVFDLTRPLIFRAVNMLKSQLGHSSGYHNFIPSSAVYAIAVLAPYAELEMLLDLVKSILNAAFAENCSDSSSMQRDHLSVKSLWIYLVIVVFKNLPHVSKQEVGKNSKSNWTTKDLQIHYTYQTCIDIYRKVAELAMNMTSEAVDHCLLSALQVLATRSNLLGALFLDFAQYTPLRLLRQCMQNVSKLKAKIVFLLIQTNMIHFFEFGHMFSVGKECPSEDVIDVDLAAMAMESTIISPRTDNINMSDHDLLLLLPSANYYLINAPKTVSCARDVSNLTLVYMQVVLKCIKDWDASVDSWIKECSIEFDNLLTDDKVEMPTDVKSFYEHSLIAVFVSMLAQCLRLHPPNAKEVRRLLKLLLPETASLLGPVLVESRPLSKLLTCKVVANLRVLLLLLFSEGGSEVQTGLCDSRRKNKILIRFMGAMIDTLSYFYKNLLFMSNDQIKNDVEATGMKQSIAECDLVAFLEQNLFSSFCTVVDNLDLDSCLCQYMDRVMSLTKLVLYYRFGETIPMGGLRNLFEVVLRNSALKCLPVCVQAAADATDLLLSHSDFTATLLDKKELSFSRSVKKGTSLSSISSILCLVASPDELLQQTTICGNNTHCTPELESTIHEKRGEIIKLLRVLSGFETHESNQKTRTVSSKEIFALLLAAYNATMSSVDLEILKLMQEIEFQQRDGFDGLAGLDYLWGYAALKKRTEETKTNLQGTDSMSKEYCNEVRKRRYKEDLCIDPQRCGITIWFFPIKRRALSAQPDLSLEDKDHNSGWNPADENVPYDPAFILPFSLHALSSQGVDPEEFVRLGLLAIAFMSISSEAESMRSLGYEVLSKFMIVLEECASFRGKTQVMMLLNHVKNAITEPLQRLPSVLAVFAAEASCILMHPENQQYLAVNRSLLHAPSIDLENVPLFYIMLGSGTSTHRNERLWMLRLLAAGLVSSQDAHVYRRQFILEILMSLYKTPMIDKLTRRWILQVVKRAIGIPSMCKYLMENTGLLLWLASLTVDVVTNKLLLDEKESLEDASLALQLIQSLPQKLRQGSMLGSPEEYYKIALMMHQFLEHDASSSKQQKIFRRPALSMMQVALKLSQKEKSYKPHFSLSMQGAWEIVQWVEAETTEPCVDIVAMNETRNLALCMLLHSRPPSVSTEKEKCQLFFIGRWALSSLVSECPTANHDQVYNNAKGYSESLAEKLLRWLSAAIILGGMRFHMERRQGLHNPGNEQFDTCWSFISSINIEKLKTGESRAYDVQLAMQLLSLQILLGATVSCSSLKSMVNALLLLLLPQFTICNARQGLQGCDNEMVMDKNEELSSVYLPQEFQKLLTLLLSDVSSPEETNASWLWSFYKPWTANARKPSDQISKSSIQVELEYEVLKLLLVIFQKLLDSPPGSYTEIVASWLSSTASWLKCIQKRKVSQLSMGSIQALKFKMLRKLARITK